MYSYNYSIDVKLFLNIHFLRLWLHLIVDTIVFMFWFLIIWWFLTIILINNHFLILNNFFIIRDYINGTLHYLVDFIIELLYWRRNLFWNIFSFVRSFESFQRWGQRLLYIIIISQRILYQNLIRKLQGIPLLNFFLRLILMKTWQSINLVNWVFEDVSWRRNSSWHNPRLTII
jgi:hypothetical protein